MYEKWGPDFYKKCMCTGGSAGTIFAIALALGKNADDLNRMYRTVAEKTHQFGTMHYGSVFMEECLRELLQDPHAYKLLEGRCCFGTTSFFSNHRWHISWVDNEDLIYTATGSCHIPFYCQKNHGIKGILIVDGAYGFSGTDLPHGDDTLYVGIDPHAEITRHFTNNQMLHPAVGKEYDEIVESGYKAFQEWDGNYNKKVGLRKPNYQALIVLWFLKIFEFIYYFFHWLMETIINKVSNSF